MAKRNGGVVFLDDNQMMRMRARHAPPEMVIGSKAPEAEVFEVTRAKLDEWQGKFNALLQRARDAEEGLTVELQRVEALAKTLKAGEWRGEDEDQGKGCPWCSASFRHVGRHTDNCSAFTPDGLVREAGIEPRR